MRLKYRIEAALKFLTFAFYPKITLIACMFFSAIVIAILGFVMMVIPQESNWYNIVFALATGAVASFFVSFIVEMAGNYRHNKLAWYELQEYYRAVIDYEMNKQVMMQLTPNQRARKKAYGEFIDAGGIEDIDEDDKPKDIIKITWEYLPKMIPVFIQTLDSKKEFLSDAEINALKNIISESEQIQRMVYDMILIPPLLYDVLNDPDEDYLKSIYPLNILNNMPEWVKNHIASNESQKACKRYAKEIMSDSFLLSQFMENYDISQNGLDDYQDELDKLEEVEEECEFEYMDYDELDFSEPDDEETFRAQIEDFDREMELKQRPFVNWHLSNCCKNIADSIDIIEKSIRNKPYCGSLIKILNNFERESLDDAGVRISYEYEKKRLDKKLAKQKEVKNKD